MLDHDKLSYGDGWDLCQNPNFVKMFKNTIPTHILLRSLYFALTSDQWDMNFIDYLIHHPAMDINAKIFYGNSSLLLAIASLKHLKAINYLTSLNDINIKSKDEKGQMFFFKLFGNSSFNPEDLTCFSCLTMKERRVFLNYQLECVAKRMDLYTYYQRNDYKHEEVNVFIEFCLSQGANLNKRNKANQRPLDIAHQSYTSIQKNTFSYQDQLFLDKRELYFSFLRKTPQISSRFIAILLGKTILTKDTIKSIMGYHVQNTIDLYIAHLPKDKWPRNKKKEKELKKRLLDHHCKKFEYLNPLSKQCADTPRNRLSIA